MKKNIPGEKGGGLWGTQILPWAYLFIYSDSSISDSGMSVQWLYGKKNSNFKLTAHMWIKNLISLEFLFLMKNKLEIRFAWKYIMFRYTMNRGETREEYAWYLIIVPWDMDLQAYLQKVAKICKLYQ